jgi:hypothetical protein
VSPAIELPPSPEPALPVIPPLSSPAMLLDPAAVCPALFFPAAPELPPGPSLGVPSLEPQFTTTANTDGTRINQPIFLIFYLPLRVCYHCYSVNHWFESLR